MSESLNQSGQNTTKQTPTGVMQDIGARLARKEKEAILAVVACAIALLQFAIGATGGALLTAAMLMNLALIGWLGNTAYQRWKGGDGAGLLALCSVAFILATLSTLYLAEGIADIVRVAQAFNEM